MYKCLYVNLDCFDFVSLAPIGLLTYSNIKKYCDAKNLNVVLDDFGNIFIEPHLQNKQFSCSPSYKKVAVILKGGRYEKA